jgi:hypothetical protein
MNRMLVTQDVSDIWIRAVKDGKIVNEFDTQNGEKIHFGLAFQNGNLEYYAKNIKTGCEISALVEERTIDQNGFVIQFNGFRALKPGGKIPNIGKQPNISAEATDCRFYCQDPKRGLSILKRDPIFQVALPNWKWNAYYNATPFEKEGHFLLLPISVDGTTTVIPHISQEVSRAFLEDILVLFKDSGNLVVFFNSLHAGASVNHIHFQAVFYKRTLSIETTPTVKKNGLVVLDGYPASGIVFNRGSEPDEIYPHIDILQKKKIPFNLIFIGERICLIPRDLEHEVVEEFPTGVIASMELAGKIITVDRNIYDGINHSIIQAAFRKTAAKEA